MPKGIRMPVRRRRWWWQLASARCLFFYVHLTLFLFFFSMENGRRRFKFAAGFQPALCKVSKRDRICANNIKTLFKIIQNYSKFCKLLQTYWILFRKILHAGRNYSLGCNLTEHTLPAGQWNCPCASDITYFLNWWNKTRANLPDPVNSHCQMSE
jgi:hypothetical protein